MVFSGSLHALRDLVKKI